MLGYIILVALQFALAFLGAPYILAKIPVSGDPKTFVHAAIYALIVWVVGIVGSFALRDVRMPGSSTLVSTLVGALIGAVIMLVPAAMQPIQAVIKFPPLYLPLIGAIIGYMIRR